MPQQSGSLELFLVFSFAILILFLIPFTVYQIFFVKEKKDDNIKPWEQEDITKAKQKRKLFTTGNIILVVLWILAGALLFFISTQKFEYEVFDPFKILEISSSASDQEIRKAYRKLVVQYHPDKNKEEGAEAKFISIERAYKALTDEVAKKNLLEYGDPDGPRPLEMSIALPKFLFSDNKDSKIVILIGLVSIGFILPLVGVALYITMSNKNQKGQFGSYIEETSMLYLEKGIKQSLNLKNVPEALVLAADFMYQKPLNKVQLEKFSKLRKILIEYNSEYADPKHKIWKLHSGTVGIYSGNVLKAYIYLMIHLLREQNEIPPELIKDYNFVLKRLQDLIKQFIALCFVPRPPSGAWLIPAVSAIEFSQSLYQAVNISDRKSTALQNKYTDYHGQLMQIPNMNDDTLKAIQKRKVKDINDIAVALKVKPGFLEEVGMKNQESIDQAKKMIITLPQIQMMCKVYVEEEESITAKDIVTIEVSTLLFRYAHEKLSSSKAIKGDKITAYTPYFPSPKIENWYFVLCQQETNLITHARPVLLSDAERAGIDYGPEKNLKLIRTDSDNLTDEQRAYLWDHGQRVKIQFQVPKEGQYKFTIFILSDCYVGVDKGLPIKFDVKPLTKEEELKRQNRAEQKEQQLKQNQNKDEEESEKGEEEEEEEGADDYDSDETGSIETIEDQNEKENLQDQTQIENGKNTQTETKKDK